MIWSTQDAIILQRRNCDEEKKINRLFYAPLDKTNIRSSFLFFHCCSEHVSNYFPESAKTKEISIFHCLVSGKFHRYTLFPFEARQ